MMARVSVGTEALSHRERISSLTSVIRDHRMASRRDKLLGLTSSSASSSPANVFSEGNDVNEFKEEDVWAAESTRSSLEDGFVEKIDSGSVVSNGRRWLGLDAGVGLSALSRSSANWEGGGVGRVASASRMVPQMVVASSVDNSRRALHQSAPVNVPDWSKILGVDHKNKQGAADSSTNWEDDEDEDGEERLPPHELVARRQATTFSVYEGAGRTLKGRDLSRVRNAVLKQTGFL